MTLPDWFVLDTSVYNRLVESEPQIVIALRGLKEAGQVVLLGTHVQQEQLAADPDEQRRERKLAIYDELTVDVPTGGGVLRSSRLGRFDLMDDRDVPAFDRDLRTPLTHYWTSPGHPLCGDATGSPSYARQSERATCVPCREARGEPTDRFRDRNTGDALIIETALREDATFVTDEKQGEKRSALERACRHQPKVLHTDDFFRWVLAHEAAPPA